MIMHSNLEEMSTSCQLTNQILQYRF